MTLTFNSTASATALLAIAMTASPAWAACFLTPLGTTCTADTSSSDIASFSAYMRSNGYTNMLTGTMTDAIRAIAVKWNSATGKFDAPRTSMSGQTGLAGSAADSRFSAWAALSSNSLASTFQPLASSGRASSVLAGFDYTYSGGTLAGVALGTDSSRINTTFNAGSVNASGYTIAPYFTMPLASNLMLDGSLGLGWGKIDSNVGGGVSGNTKDRRTFGSLGLTYFTRMSDWQLQATGSLLSSSSKVNAFNLSNAAAIADSTSGVTQMRLGGRASYGSGQFVPFAGLTYSQDLGRTDIAPLAGQTAANARGAVIAQAGVNINQAGVVSGSIGLSSELRNQVRNNGLVATISMKF